MEQEITDYEQAVEYLLDIPKFTGKNTLTDTKVFLQRLSCPQEHMKIIHIAGTNGKGSVCAYLCSILMEAGYTVGSFTSPHLIELNERIQINRVPVEKEEILEAFCRIQKELEAFRKESSSKYHPSFFEYLFFLALLIFEKKKPDYVILETGLGGRLDSTNSIDNPLVSVITRIGMDHMQYLGDTLAKIAEEKAGIIKPGIPVVYDSEVKEAAQVIQTTADDFNSQSFPVSNCDYALLKFNKKSIAFSYKSRYYDSVRLCLDTTAFYQMENASLALRTAELLLGQEVLTPPVMEQAMLKTHWEGRMEQVLDGVFVDGAHNEDGIEAFLDSVRQDGCEGCRYLIFGAVRDKAYDRMAAQLLESHLFTQITAAGMENGRALSEEEMRAAFADTEDRQMAWYPDAASAYEALQKRKRPEDRIYLAGSLYLVGEFKAYLRMRGSHD